MDNGGERQEPANLLEEAGRALGRLPRWGLERALDTARRVTSPSGYNSAYPPLSDQVQNLATSALRRSAEAARISTSPHATAATLIEMRNKAEVYFLVRGNRHSLGIPSPYPQPFPLGFYLERAYDREDFSTLFAVEGLGREFGRSQWLRNRSPSGLLHEAAHLPLPRKSLLMLHAGLGMSFAKELLDHLPQNPTRLQLEQAVDQFVTLCKRNSRGGYQIAALEPLGLVTRTFHPRLTGNLDEILSARYPELRSLYWHGVGRAVYFLPQNALPCATWDAFLQCERECVDELSREQLFAGQGWAFSMVNFRQPEVLLQLFVGPYAHKHPLPHAFQRGVAAALVMREETTPGAPMIKQLQEFDAIPLKNRDDWNRLVLRPAQRALAELAAVSSAAVWMNQAFRYTESESDSPPAPATA